MRFRHLHRKFDKNAVFVKTEDLKLICSVLQKMFKEIIIIIIIIAM